MNKTQSTLFFSLLMVGASQGAVTVPLDLPAAGNYSTPTDIVTTIAVGTGSTFDITYSIGGAISNGANPYANSTGSQIGVGSDTDIAAHFNTLEGNDGEGLSFVGISVSNFQANGSGQTIADVTNLQFEGITLSAVGNARDRAGVSFTDFTVSELNVVLNGTGTGGLSVYEIPLSSLGNFSSTADDLFIRANSGFSSNRWNVSGLSVSFVPEPSSSLLLGGSGLLMLLHRRRS